ncbi:MAG: phage integrase N-terminal SAM-like domain-containing protein, partial [Phycisphaerae bacterium]
MKNWGQNVCEGLSVGAEEGGRLVAFLNANDFAPGTRDGYVFDLRKFARWFSGANHEPLTASRVTTRDITDFRTYLHRERQQAVATVNRSLVLIRRYFQWLADQGHIPTNPAKAVKELRRQMLAPKGLERPQVRRLLREAELRGDVRANAIFNLMLFSGCRVSDAINIDLADLVLGEKSGSVVYRYGKG